MHGDGPTYSAEERGNRFGQASAITGRPTNAPYDSVKKLLSKSRSTISRVGRSPIPPFQIGHIILRLQQDIITCDELGQSPRMHTKQHEFRQMLSAGMSPLPGGR